MLQLQIPDWPKVRRWTAPATLCLVVALFSTPSAADSLRCGTVLIVPGETKPNVVDYCGRPIWTEVISGADERRVEQWIYRLPGKKLERVLTFRGLHLVSIQTRSR